MKTFRLKNQRVNLIERSDGVTTLNIKSLVPDYMTIRYVKRGFRIIGNSIAGKVVVEKDVSISDDALFAIVTLISSQLTEQQTDALINELVRGQERKYLKKAI